MRLSLNEASKLLLNGHVVAVPTETVYGLAAALNQPKAIDTIFAIKRRPSGNPLIIHVPETKVIESFSRELPDRFHDLANVFWPGPLTMVLPIDTTKVPEKVRANLPTAAFRVPRHPVAHELLQRTGSLVMPSANLSGKPSATKPEHVEKDFGDHFPIVDGGGCKCGLESTIIYFNNSQWQIIRLGAIAPEQFLPILGYVPKIQINNGKAICPGQMYRHYAPNAYLRLCEKGEKLSEVVIGFSDRTYPKATRVITLGDTHNPEIVAEVLYSILRQLDQEGIMEAHVDMDFPSTGLWTTIRERLQKAANK